MSVLGYNINDIFIWVYFIHTLYKTIMQVMNLFMLHAVRI